MVEGALLTVARSGDGAEVAGSWTAVVVIRARETARGIVVREGRRERGGSAVQWIETEGTYVLSRDFGSRQNERIP